MAQFTKQMTVSEFEALFPDDDACKTYLMRRRWPDGVRCPRCGNDKVAELKARPFHWQCKACAPNGYRFSVLVGTIFENTNIGLRDWFRVIYMMLTGKKGVAALEVQRVMGFGSYSTAHYMCHRIRAGLVDPEFRKLMGIVEADETYVGEGQEQARRQGAGRTRHARSHPVAPTCGNGPTSRAGDASRSPRGGRRSPRRPGRTCRASP